jgi:hypothetical protein
MSGIIYLVQPCELVGTDVFKVGCSTINSLTRVQHGYKLGTRYIQINECINPLYVEKLLIKECKKKFKLTAGREYFKCDETEIREVFERIIKDNTIIKSLIKPLNNANNINIQIKSVNPVICEHCKKTFIHDSSLSRHKNHLRCKKMTKDVTKNIISKTNNIVTNSIKLEQATLDNKITNKTKLKNQTKLKNATNIKKRIKKELEKSKVNSFEKETFIKVKKKQKINILNSLHLGIDLLLKTIYYDIPENRTFYISNKKNREHITFYNGKDAIYEDANIVKEKIYNNIIKLLELWFTTLKETLEESKLTNLELLFKSCREEKIKKQYFNSINKYLLSYSSEIKKGINNIIKLNLLDN